MNDQQEINALKAKSKWSGKRIVLFYWVALMFLGSGFAVGLGTGVLSPKYTYEPAYDHSGITGQWDHTDCDGCHPGAVDAWNETGHANGGFNDTADWISNATGDYLVFDEDRIVLISGFAGYDGGGSRAVCARCHTTNWENNSGVYSYWEVAIGCPACHEPGTTPSADESCANCHNGGEKYGTGHGDMFESYDKSHHVDSMADLLASGHPSDSCLHCMASEGLFTNMTGVTPAAGLGSIDCVTCHDSHNEVETYAAGLRFEDSTELCGECHGTSGRHTTYETFTATGSAHKSVAECTTCHGYEVGSHGDEVNHTWSIVNMTDTCGQCHDEGTALDGKLEDLETIQGDYADMLAAYNTQLTNVTNYLNSTNATVGLTAAMQEAYDLLDEAEALLLYVEGDMSKGFHNPTLIEGKFDTAMDKLNDAYAKATTAATPVPGFELVGLLAAFGFLGFAVLFFKKRR